MPPADPAPACACGLPHADWCDGGVRVCARCAMSILVVRNALRDPTPKRGVDIRHDDENYIPKRLRHGKPADPAAVPPPVPEWMAKALGHESVSDFNECYLANSYYEAPKRELVRLLASVREGALREAARLCWNEARAWDKIPGTDNGAREVVCDDLSDAILALIEQSPKGEA